MTIINLATLLIGSDVLSSSLFSMTSWYTSQKDNRMLRARAKENHEGTPHMEHNVMSWRRIQKKLVGRQLDAVENVALDREGYFGCKDSNEASQGQMREFFLPYIYQMTMATGQDTHQIVEQTILEVESIVTLGITEQSCALMLGGGVTKDFWFSSQPGDSTTNTDLCIDAASPSRLCQTVRGGFTIKVPYGTILSDDLTCNILSSVETLLQSDEVTKPLPNIHNIVAVRQASSTCQQQSKTDNQASPSKDGVNEPLVLIMLVFVVLCIVVTILVLKRIKAFRQENRPKGTGKYTWPSFLKELGQDIYEHLQRISKDSYERIKIVFGRMAADLSTKKESASKTIAQRIRKTKSKDSVTSSSAGDDDTLPSSMDGEKCFKTLSMGVVWDDFAPGAFPTGRPIGSSVNGSSLNGSQTSSGVLDVIPETEEVVCGHGRESDIMYDVDINLSGEMSEL